MNDERFTDQESLKNASPVLTPNTGLRASSLFKGFFIVLSFWVFLFFAIGAKIHFGEYEPPSELSDNEPVASDPDDGGGDPVVIPTELVTDKPATPALDNGNRKEADSEERTIAETKEERSSLVVDREKRDEHRVKQRISEVKRLLDKEGVALRENILQSRILQYPYQYPDDLKREYIRIGREFNAKIGKSNERLAEMARKAERSPDSVDKAELLRVMEERLESYRERREAIRKAGL